jgi:hypothetical protein
VAVQQLSSTSGGFRFCLIAALVTLAFHAGLVKAQDDGGTTDSPAPQRPTISFQRWQENWSALADPSLRTEPLDELKYIPLMPDDPTSYVSFGANLRERFESEDVNSFGIGGTQVDDYVIQRFEVFADIHPDEHWQIFTELQDDRAFGKTVITPVDEDPLDLEQAFVAYTNSLGGGDLKIRVGRQEMAFDLQRFVSARDGPNVRQAFDAIWLDWEKGRWRFITFWSHPVIDRHEHPFDDFSSSQYQFGGFRVELKDVGPGKLSTYYARLDQDNAHYLFANGDERRNICDIRYTGDIGGFDWDLEGMSQSGRVGQKNARGWALGSLAGYTFQGAPWQPRVGIQIDAASGNRRPDSSTLGTFNPLFPNGYYVNLSGGTGYTNFIHVKPSLTVHPTSRLALLAAIGLQWRESTSDAIYTQPNIPLPGTAGQPGAWSSAYGQVRADWALSEHWAGALEAVHYQVGDVIRQAGGHDSNYLGVELRFGW